MNKKLLKKILFIILTLIFIAILYLVLKYDSNIFDKKGYGFISNYISDTNTTIAKIFTFLGSTLFITILCVLSLFFKKYRVTIISNTLIVVGISQALKFIIRRSRPLDIALIKETGFSFPSGHSMVSAAFYGLIIYLIYKSKLKKQLKILLIVLFSLIILNIGLSRIYLGVHYTTDVLAGFILAAIHLILFVELIYKKYFEKEK